ncbi:MAG: cysteine desulfurase [Bacteroidetes bacterium]|nr:cysteine desulfurase [Bacteroidota bacterium]
MRLYFDNASTTKLDPKVVDIMEYALRNLYGNPSSLHRLGREAKHEIEKSRKNIAEILNTNPDRIIFNSGGTESNNWIIKKSIKDLGIKHIITSKIEHMAVLNPLYELEKNNIIRISNVKLNSLGHIDYLDLEQKLKNITDKTFVILMHANNEIGNISDIKLIGELCKKYNALFHSDTIQTMGFHKFDLSTINLDFALCSAHKLHGPKGVGFIYINDKIKLNPLISGGEQEFGLRGGTENLIGIIGLGKAFEIAYEDLNKNELYIKKLKNKLINELKKEIPKIKFNGDCENLDKSLDKIVNIRIPNNIDQNIAILKLDMKGIAVSSGSACSSGTIKSSHVIDNINKNEGVNIRISLSKFNTEEEISKLVKALKDLF